MSERIPALIAHCHMKRSYTRDTIEYDRVDEDLPDRQVDIPKLKRGGVGVIWLSEGGPGEFAVDGEAMQRGGVGPNDRPAVRTCFVGPSEVQRMLRGFDAMHRLCRRFTSDLGLATTVREARAAMAQGKTAVFLHTEALLIANDLAVLRAYHAMGLRCSGMVHGSPLDWVDCDLEQRHPGGLTDFGRKVVREMNAMGIVIDVSHASEQAIRDVLRETRQPIVASHSNVKKLAPIQRNLSDESIKGIAAAGGVIGLHCSSAFVDINCLYGRRNTRGEQYSGLRLDMIGKVQVPGAIDPFGYEVEMRSRYGPPPEQQPYFPKVRAERLLEHVDYLVHLAGIDHVGIGTDFEFLADSLEGYDDVSKTQDFLQLLLRHGYSESDVRKIASENFLRVMQAVIGE